MILLKHKDTGLTKECPTGFSWTTLFFGIFVPLLRGDIKWALIMFIICLCTAGLAWLVFPFIYNKKYIRSLMAKGFIPADNTSRQWCVNKGLLLSEPVNKPNPAGIDKNFSDDLRLLENSKQKED